MTSRQPGTRTEELHAIVTQKLTALVREMEDADWTASAVAITIREVIEERWLSQAEALQTVRESVPHGFVSDGNEG